MTTLTVKEYKTTQKDVYKAKTKPFLGPQPP